MFAMSLPFPHPNGNQTRKKRFIEKRYFYKTSSTKCGAGQNRMRRQKQGLNPWLARVKGNSPNALYSWTSRFIEHPCTGCGLDSFCLAGHFAPGNLDFSKFHEKKMPVA
jgi:hypothetical protein